MQTNILRRGSGLAATRVLAIGLLTAFLATTSAVRGSTVWTGPMTVFSEVSSDPTLEMNQDRMTGAVWITRAQTEGIFNAVTETSFTHFYSPADTEWADGNLSDYASLSYNDWNTWAKSIHTGPPSTVGVNAVVHLISDDIYVGIMFTSWGGTAGLFGYQRTTPAAVVTPIPLAIARSGNSVIVSWTDASFSLQSSTNVAGPYTTIAGATSPYTNSISGGQMFFRLIH